MTAIPVAVLNFWYQSGVSNQWNHRIKPEGKVDESAEENVQVIQSFRFGAPSLLLVTVLGNAVAAFMRPYGDRGFVVGAFTIVASIVIGLLASVALGKPLERVLWALFSAMIIQVLTTNVLQIHAIGYYAWPLVAAISAALLAGSSLRLIIRVLIGMVSATIAFAAYVLILGEPIGLLMPEFVCAPIGGGLLAVLMECCTWIEQRYELKLMMIGSGLVLLAVATAVLGKAFVPLW